jgi:hypothetical protein
MNKSRLNSKSGQAVIESILIIVVLMGITLLVARLMKDNNIVADLVSGPWERLDGMIQNGVWLPAERSYGYHPNSYYRTISLEGEVVE